MIAPEFNKISFILEAALSFISEKSTCTVIKNSFLVFQFNIKFENDHFQLFVVIQHVDIVALIKPNHERMYRVKVYKAGFLMMNTLCFYNTYSW